MDVMEEINTSLLCCYKPQSLDLKGTQAKIIKKIGDFILAY